MGWLTYALGLRGALRWLGEVGRGLGVGPSTPGQVALGVQGEGHGVVGRRGAGGREAVARQMALGSGPD